MENGDPDVKRPRLDPLHTSGHPTSATGTITTIATTAPPPPPSPARPGHVVDAHPHPSHIYAPGFPQPLPPPAQPHHPHTTAFRETTTAPAGSLDHRSLAEQRALPDPTVLGGYPNHRPGYGTPVNPSQPRSYSVDSSFTRPSVGPPQPAHTEAQRRPFSDPSASEGPSTPMEHGPSTQMYSLPEHHVHNGVPNGYSVAHQHEPYSAGPMGPQQSYGPPGYAPSPYSAGPQGYNVPRRKQVRAVQACNACRQRKQKCDEQRPCSFCSETGLACEYREIPPQKQDRTTMMVIDELKEISSRLGKLEQGLGKVLPEFKRARQHDRPPDPSRDISAGNSPTDVSKTALRAVSEQPDMPLTATTTPIQRRSAPLPMPDPAILNEDEEPLDSTEGPTANQMELAVHTTPAHQLLCNEACMAQFRQPNRYPKDYPLAMENARGLLRLYGRGEGSDIGDGGHGAGQLTTANSPSEDNSPAPSPPEGLWGNVFPVGPPSSVDSRRSEPPYVGGLNLDGSMYLDERVIRRLFQSYLSHIHILHPFLNLQRLARMVETFISRYSTNPNFPKPAFAVPSNRNHMESYGGLPQKRKLSTGPLPPSTPSSGYDSAGYSKRIPERSIGNAIILLVLALGRICEFRKVLPGPVSTPDTPSGCDTSSMVENALQSPAPIKQSPSSSSPTVSVSSPATDVSRMSQRSGRSSVEPLGAREKGEQVGGPRNLERTPGLAYYTFATDILGNLHNGNELAHCQAFLLAGLYMGQLARAMESWGWINTACRSWMVLVTRLSRDDISSVRKNNPQRDLYKLAFWTCLQLESDIHAELSELPLSGIAKYEDTVVFPAGVREALAEQPGQHNEMDLFYYSAQIVLRRTLNRVHRSLYAKRKKDSGGESIWERGDSVEYHEMLESWRTSLPAPLQWSDDDPAATDINAARMRAKYYGARYIINRPFLMAALKDDARPYGFGDTNYRSETARSGSSSTSRSAGMDQLLSPSAPAPPPPPTLTAKELEHCRICVASARKSTVAFDNVPTMPHRLIVTNIWGTAHAQFGNMLVLAATYNCHNPALRALISFEELQRLMARTINFLNTLASLSPVMKQDAEILKYTYKKVSGGDVPLPHSTQSSFGGPGS